MNNSIEQLVVLAKKERVPEIDVASSVMGEIRSIKMVRISSIKPMGIVAAISALAASIVIVFAVHSYKEATNPMMGLFEPLSQEPLLVAFYND